MDFGEYSINALKTFDTPDGGGYNCNILRNGKKVATAHEAGQGGEIDIDWLDWEEKRVEIHNTNYKGEKNTYKGTPEEKLFVEFLETLPRVESRHFDDGLKVCAGIFFEEMVRSLEDDRDVKKWLKKWWCFKTSHHEPGEFGHYPKVFKGHSVPKERVIVELIKKYGDNYKFLESKADFKEAGIITTG